MKELLIRLVVLCATVAIISPVEAQPLIWRGDVVVELEDMDARMSRFPEFERAEYSRNPENLARTMNQLVINRALAREARELGLDQDEQVRKDLELAVEEVLAIHRMNLLLRDEAMPDFEPFARENYLANPGAWTIPEARVVEHVLVKAENRTDDEALELATEILGKARSGADFAELVQEYSEDSSKARNNGRFMIVDPAEFQPEFSAGAKALANAGDLSEPIKTSFGYHIIRLVDVTPEQPRSFEDVSGEIIRGLRNEYRKTARGDYLTALRGKLGVEEGDVDLLMTLPHRYGGRPEQAPATEAQGN